ncbi:hypothetical protein GCM10028807_09730 [Spirosoma daeguense]
MPIQTPTLSGKEPLSQPEQLTDNNLSDEEKPWTGIPSQQDQERYNENHRRAMEKLTKKDSFFQPVDHSKLTEKGKEDRARVAAANHIPTQLDAILERLESSVRANYRRQVLGFDIACQVIKRTFEIELSRKSKEIDLSDEQIVVLENIIRYFIGAPNSPYPLHKGLFLYGGYGVGKTFLFRAMQTLCRIAPIPDMQFEEISTKTFVTAWKNFKDGKEKKNNPVLQYSRGNLLLDDLGEEVQKIMSFTNVENPIDELLSERYVAFDRYGQVTHVTTNLGLGDSENALEEQLVKLYGSRILDRFNDMFEVILLPGDSKRG